MNERLESQSGFTRPRWLQVLGLLLVAMAGAVWYVVTLPPEVPLPSVVTGAVSYQVYYPKPLPKGYSYHRGSAKLEQDNIIVYKLGLGAKTITVAEQPMPSSPPDLAHLPGFTTAQTPIGDAAFGQANNAPSAIILSPGTLVSLLGVNGATLGDIQATADSLASVSGH
jgi:hypothetical protein